MYAIFSFKKVIAHDHRFNLGSGQSLNQHVTLGIGNKQGCYNAVLPPAIPTAI
jgi:hypothetical protein